MRWTVEWIHPGESPKLGICDEFQTISDAHKAHLRRSAVTSSSTHPDGQENRNRSPRKVAGGAISASETTAPVQLPTDHLNGTPKSEETHSAYFYLHLPRQPSRRPVLRYLSPDATPAGFLQGQVILEYPTIYVLHRSPSTLPPHYVLDTDFFKHRRMGNDADTTNHDQPEEGEINEDAAANLGEEKLERLEDVLNQDLKGLSGISEVP